LKKPAKVTGGLSAPSSSDDSVVCSGLQSLTVATKHKGKKKGIKRIRATAIVDGKPKKEVDNFVFTCQPRQGACPTTTTTTTSTRAPSTTTTPGATTPPSTTVPPVCGDGKKNQSTEECDGSDFGDTTCTSPGGALVCTADCKIDRTQCTAVTLTRL